VGHRFQRSTCRGLVTRSLRGSRYPTEAGLSVHAARGLGEHQGRCLRRRHPPAHPHPAPALRRVLLTLHHVTAHPMGILAEQGLPALSVTASTPISDAIARVDGEYAQAQFAWRRNSSVQNVVRHARSEPTQTALDAALAGELASVIYAMCKPRNAMTFREIHLLVTPTDEWFGSATERIYRACKMLVEQVGSRGRPVREKRTMSG
jgi:hypothetical protein